VHLPGAILVGLSTAFHQSYLRSSGRLEPSQVAIAAAAARVAWNRGEAVIVGLHHPPEARLMKAIAWIDGLAGHESLLDVMRAHDHVFALHGHTHVAADRAVRSGAVARIFSAPSVVSHESPLRLYRVRGGLVTPEVEPERVERPSLAAAF
jgi:3',5'-cyclic AMP phosphodiesterase CpdA